MISFDPVVGWCIIHELLTPTEARSIRRECQRLLTLAEPDRMVRDKPHAGTHHLVQLDERIKLVADVLQRRLLRNTVADIIGEPIDQLQVSYRSPQPGFGGQKLHTDGLAKLDDGPDTLATAVVPLVDFTSRNGATRVVPRSHRRTDLQRLAGNLDHHETEILLTGPVGSAFVFSGHLLHSGTKNEGEDERPALQLQWQRLA